MQRIEPPDADHDETVMEKSNKEIEQMMAAERKKLKGKRAKRFILFVLAILLLVLGVKAVLKATPLPPPPPPSPPDSKTVLLNRATLALHHNKLAEAERDFTKLLQIDPTNEPAKKHLETVRTKQEAIRATREAAHSLVGRALHSGGDT